MSPVDRGGFRQCWVYIAVKVDILTSDNNVLASWNEAERNSSLPCSLSCSARSWLLFISFIKVLLLGIRVWLVQTYSIFRHMNEGYEKALGVRYLRVGLSLIHLVSSDSLTDVRSRSRRSITWIATRGSMQEIVTNADFVLTRQSERTHLWSHSQDFQERTISLYMNAAATQVSEAFNIYGFFPPGDRPYSCAKCNRTFATSADCRVHDVVHTGSKPVGYIRSHRYTTSTDGLTLSGVKLYTCVKCNRSYKTRSGLWGHKRTCQLHVDSEVVAPDSLPVTYTYRSQDVNPGSAGHRPFDMRPASRGLLPVVYLLIALPVDRIVGSSLSASITVGDTSSQTNVAISTGLLFFSSRGFDVFDVIRPHTPSASATLPFSRSEWLGKSSEIHGTLYRTTDDVDAADTDVVDDDVMMLMLSVDVVYDDVTLVILLRLSVDVHSSSLM
jgi:hypothetical protein